MIKIFLTVIVIALTLISCSKETLVGSRFGPDPLLMKTHKALDIPNNLTYLPVPEKHAKPQSQMQDLESILLSGTSTQPVNKQLSNELLTKMNPDHASIPSDIDRQYHQTAHREKRLLDDLISNKSNQPILDTDAEEKRLKSGGKGQVPIILPSGQKAKI